jgi:16S rRNA (guanine966-N2)-methyltransferase
LRRLSGSHTVRAVAGDIRITGGTLRGRRLRSPKGGTVRPTAARVREAVFSVLGGRIAGARVLDLYAGAGTLGLEALSRGAAFAAFVDRAARNAALIRENAAALGLSDRVWVGTGEAVRFLARKSPPGAPYDVAFVDPPYRAGALAAVLPALFGADIIAAAGLAVLEHPRELAVPAGPGWAAGRTYTYGTTAITLVHPAPTGAEGPGG